jgi:hypothetical protein
LSAIKALAVELLLSSPLAAGIFKGNSQLTHRFLTGNKQELCQKILSGQYTAPDYVSAELKDLLSRMLIVDPDLRITFPEVWHRRLLMVHMPSFMITKSAVLSTFTQTDVPTSRHTC